MNVSNERQDKAFHATSKIHGFHPSKK